MTLSRNGVTYVTKMKKNLKYTVQKDIMYMNDDGLMTCREQWVTFTKEENKEKIITHHAKIVRNRSWSFSGLATIIRITLMYYVNCIPS